MATTLRSRVFALTATMGILLLLFNVRLTGNRMRNNKKNVQGVGMGKNRLKSAVPDVALRPETVLPNSPGDTGSWEGVRSDSGTRSPFYGDAQRRHQEWLLQRAEDVRDAGVGGYDGGAGAGGGGRRLGEVSPVGGREAVGSTRSARGVDGGDDDDDEEEDNDDHDVDIAPARLVASPGSEGYGDESGHVGREMRPDVTAAAAAGKDKHDVRNFEGGNRGGERRNLPVADPAAAAVPSTAVVSGGSVGVGAAFWVASDGDGVGAASISPEPVPRRRRRLRRRKQSQEQRQQQPSGGAMPAPAANRTAASLQPSRGRNYHFSWSNETQLPLPPPPPARTAAAAAATTTRTTIDTVTTTARRRTRDEDAARARARTGRVDRSETAEDSAERTRRLEYGAILWGETYVPPIEPGRRRRLIKKWSSGVLAEKVDQQQQEQEQQQEQQTRHENGRILYVISSFDRGKRLGQFYKDVDKADFILMMMDEMREACEVGFSPQIHLIAAWDPSELSSLVRDRLFCTRTGEYVPYTYEEHRPSIGNNLAIQHRIYMKSRLEEYDIFLQVEDDMVLTLNHILLFWEECSLLDRTLVRPLWGGKKNTYRNSFIPGFMRIEAGEGSRHQKEWFEWEISLSRFKAFKVAGIGVYMSLRPSRLLLSGGNNQGMWIATQNQLRRMAEMKGCDYLAFDETSTNGHPETHSGSFQMFGPKCGFEKVFPVSHFEDFLVHHRSNNKNGWKGESIPGVSITMLRLWVEQFIRDEEYLREATGMTLVK